jgi:large subunit ribosomal protein L13
MKKPLAQQKPRQYVFDANGQILGRFATKVAIHVRGKMEPNFSSNTLPQIYVIIKNIDKLSISDKKMNSHVVIHFTGYPGGLRRKLWNEAYTSNPKKFFLRVVRYMLPKNRQAAKLLKFIKFE